MFVNLTYEIFATNYLGLSTIYQSMALRLNFHIHSPLQLGYFPFTKPALFVATTHVWSVLRLLIINFSND